MHFIPTALDVWHLVTWVGTVLLVAAVMGVIVFLLDRLGDFLENEPDDLSPASSGDEPEPFIGWPPLRSFTDPAAKGFKGPVVVDINRRRRELEYASGQFPSKLVH